MTLSSRLTRNRQRPATMRSSIDIWHDPPASSSARQGGTIPTIHEQQPQIIFPPTTRHFSPSHSPSPLLGPSPILGNPPGLSPKPSPKHSPVLINYSPDPALAWRDPADERKTPARLKKDAELAAKLRKLVWVVACFGVTSLVLLYLLQRPAAPMNAMETKMRTQMKQTGLLHKALKRKAPSFRDSLSSKVRYVTSPQHGGFAHQIMSLYHLTYLATILGRTPLVPPFTFGPNHPGQPVTAIFDVDRFRHTVNVTMIDWKDIQPVGMGDRKEQLGCWTATMSDHHLGDRTRRMNGLGIDPSFYPLKVGTPRGAPEGVKLNDLQLAYSFLSGFDADPSAQAGLIDQALHTSSVTTLSNVPHRDPEQHVFCVDHSLFHTVTSSKAEHLDQYEHTAFLAHGAALRFVPELDTLGGDIAAFLLGTSGSYIAVSIASQVSLGPYIEAVERVKAATSQPGPRRPRDREVRHQVRTLPVIVTTPVADIGFRGEIVNLGWTLMDANDGELREKRGKWSQEVVESVVMSRATGFVGTKEHAESTLAALRIKAWRAGAIEII